MNNTNKILGIIIGAIIVLMVATMLFTITPIGKKMWNGWFYKVQVADNDTNYDTLKNVEDTCRAMIASYESDKLVYQQYKVSDNTEKQSWAEQAKMRANKTATSYNSYILKNNYIWKDNVPDDIKSKLPIIE